MLPLELKNDKNGLLYMEDRTISRRQPLLLDKRYLDNRYYQNGFYTIASTSDYIIKYSYNAFTEKERENIYQMLENLVLKQKLVLNVDFPVGYFRKWYKLQGLIVRYYQNGISFDNVVKCCDINELGKYYYHDEDSIHNLFLFFNNILDLVYEMFENGVYYTDINAGNLVLDNNKIKIIDFDYRFVHFDKKDEQLNNIMQVYDLLLKKTLAKYSFNYIRPDGLFENFEEAKMYVKKLENKVRKG